MLSQTLMYYWQEKFLLTLVSDSEDILNRTIERVANLIVTLLGFVLVLISFVRMHGAVVVP